MYINVSFCDSFGRGGRCGGGLLRGVNGVVVRCSRTSGMFASWDVGVGRDMGPVPLLAFLSVGRGGRLLLRLGSGGGDGGRAE